MKKKRTTEQRGNLTAHTNPSNPESTYVTYTVVQADHHKGQARLPIADEETVKLAKNEVDSNHK